MSDFNLERIEENIERRSLTLELSILDQMLPESISELVWLEELTLSFNTPISRNSPISRNPFERILNEDHNFLLESLSGLTNLKIPSIYSKEHNLLLEPLSNLTNLKKLSIYSRLSDRIDLSPLSKLTKLKYMYIKGQFDLSTLPNISTLQQLNISETKCTDISPLSKLINLEQLTISGTNVTDLSPISSLKNLWQLNISDSSVINLAPISLLSNLLDLTLIRTQVADMKYLSGLSKLQKLIISFTKVTDLTPLSNLKKLQALFAEETQIRELSPLKGLSKLTVLDVRSTQVTDLSPLTDLFILEKLYISFTKITNLAPLSGLLNLKMLDIANTNVTDLKPLFNLIKNGLDTLWTYVYSGRGNAIYIKGCPLTNPPIEIVKQGNTAILNYLQEQVLLDTNRIYDVRNLTIKHKEIDFDMSYLQDNTSAKHLPNPTKGENRLKSSSKKAASLTRIIKIFLASSEELREDRDAFDLYFRQQNDRLFKQGFYLEIIRWENFLDAMSDTRLQDEYNKELKNCDIFVCLFFTKTGSFTQEEFDTAHKQFKKNKKPKIYTFFKNAPRNIGEIGQEINSLLKFKDKLASLGHFKTDYKNVEELKLKFKDQLEKLIEGI